MKKPIPPQLLETALDLWGQSTGEHILPVTGRSMFPTLKAADYISVVHDISGIQPGDIIVFRSRGELISHRLLAVHSLDSESLYLTKGDHLPYIDPAIRAGDVIGYVKSIWRGDRRLMIDTPPWRRMNRWIAKVMLGEARHYDRVKQAREHYSLRFIPDRLASLGWRGTAKSVVFLLRLLQAVAGWQKL